MNTIELYISKSEETLREAKVMFDSGFFSGTVSRAYYAGFYAVQATLESANINSKTHQGALMMFSKHFVKTGIFSRQIAKFLKENLDKRLLGDYEIGFRANQIDAQIAIEHTEEIINSIKQYLQK